MSQKIEKRKVAGYEEVVFVEDSSVGLKAIIAVHNLNRGPACGGIRMLPYATEDEALHDVLRLSRGMSYKSALANIGFGGGKSVIIRDPKHKTPELFQAFGEAINRLEGRYIGAADMNMTSEDLRTVKTRTPHILGIKGEPGSSGDPSPVTAHGVFRGMEATAEHLFGKRSLQGLHIALQGIGHVGYLLMEHCIKAGARLTVSDINEATLRKAQESYDVTVVPNERILFESCDILAPCARGAILNETSIPNLRCKAVVGAANNQLATEEDGLRIANRGILYAPDFAVNAGGIINIFVELDGYDATKAIAKADEIYSTMKEIYRRADQQNLPPFRIADRMAEERMREGR